MRCAMELHDPCEGELELHELERCQVPLCAEHFRAWRERTMPFQGWRTDERVRWAAASAELHRRRVARARESRRSTIAERLAQRKVAS
jgi:hypothetical protein